MLMPHHLLHKPSSPLPPPHIPPSDLPKQKKPVVAISRRDFAAAAATLPLLLSALPGATPQAIAELSPPPPPSCAERAVGRRAFLDVSIDGEPAGRITVGLHTSDAPAGSARFVGLVTGAAGVSYRRKEFVKITPGYVQHGGVRSYGSDADRARSAGGDLDAGGLMGEWERQREGCPGGIARRGAVGIVVRDPRKPPPTAKLVAREGRLEVREEEVRPDPNGSEFVIVAGAAAAEELEESTLVVGTVVEGMDVVERMLRVKTVQENTSSPYFRVAKLIGDKRAVVAERGFNRPYSKVVITNCGVLD